MNTDGCSLSIFSLKQGARIREAASAFEVKKKREKKGGHMRGDACG